MATNANVTMPGADLAGLLINARQDAIYAGYESSLYLPGSLMNIYDVPAGSVTAQIPKFGAIATSAVSTESHDAATPISELDLTNVSNDGVFVSAKTYAVRAMLKDLGGVGQADVGTMLGRAITERFDTDVTAMFADASITQEVGATGVDLTIDTIADAVQTVRANKFGGQVNVVLHPTQIKELMKEFTTANFAGGDFQNAALREGFVGRLFGANIFQSALIGKDNSDADYAGCAWVDGAFGIAMFRGLDVVTARNEAGLGTDVIASLHASASIVDAARAVRIISDV